jgi:hypothetical protein
LCPEGCLGGALFCAYTSNEHLFASKYKLMLPTEEELRAELDRERISLEERQKYLGSGSSASAQ